MHSLLRGLSHLCTRSGAASSSLTPVCTEGTPQAAAATIPGLAVLPHSRLFPKWVPGGPVVCWGACPPHRPPVSQGASAPWLAYTTSPTTSACALCKEVSHLAALRHLQLFPPCTPSNRTLSFPALTPADTLSLLSHPGLIPLARQAIWAFPPLRKAICQLPLSSPARSACSFCLDYPHLYLNTCDLRPAPRTPLMSQPDLSTRLASGLSCQYS